MRPIQNSAKRNGKQSGKTVPSNNCFYKLVGRELFFIQETQATKSGADLRFSRRGADF